MKYALLHTVHVWLTFFFACASYGSSGASALKFLSSRASPIKKGTRLFGYCVRIKQRFETSSRKHVTEENEKHKRTESSPAGESDKETPFPLAHIGVNSSLHTKSDSA
jgi:hypothetical protein